MASQRVREDPAKRSQQILDMAVRLIGEHGCNGFTVGELARRCGLSKGGLLHHFETKDSLVLAIIDEAERSEVQALAPLVDAALGRPGDPPPREAVLAFLYAVFARSNSDPHLGRLYVRLKAEAFDPDHLAHASIFRREAAVLRLFTQILRPFTPEPESLARRLMALLHGLTLHRLLCEDPFDAFVEWKRAVDEMLPDTKPRQRQ